jgi:hypothetical protein
MQNEEDPGEMCGSKHWCVRGRPDETGGNARLDCMRKLRNMLNKDTCVSVILIGRGKE